MFVLVRDEDPPTVAAAISVFADDQGLEPIDLSGSSKNPLQMLSMIGSPQALVSDSGGQVFVAGLESLDIAEPEEWGAELSRACEAEVLAIEIADDGVRVYVFDDGELEDTIDVMLDPSGHTKAPGLAELTDDDEGAKELEAGLVASSIDQLVPAVLRCLGVKPAAEGAVTVAFVDPMGDDEEGDEDEDAGPELGVVALPGAALEGNVAGAVDATHGGLFAVALAGAEEIEGLRLQLSGSGLGLVTIAEVVVSMRRRGEQSVVERVVRIPPEATAAAAQAGDEAVLTFDIAEAYLESVEAAPTFDMTDLFSTMQKLVSTNESQQLNTLTVTASGAGREAGEGELLLSVFALNDEDVAAGAASVAVVVK